MCCAFRTEPGGFLPAPLLALDFDPPKGGKLGIGPGSFPMDIADTRTSPAPQLLLLPVLLLLLLMLSLLLSLVLLRSPLVPSVATPRPPAFGGTLSPPLASRSPQMPESTRFGTVSQRLFERLRD